MAIVAHTTGYVKHHEDGTVTLQITQGKQYLDALGRFMGLVAVDIRKATRSVQQNRLLWLWETIIAEETGNTKEVVHEFNKKEFLKKPFMYCDKKTGELHEEIVSGTTHDMSKDAMSEYLQLIHAHWSEYGYILLWPDEYEGADNDQAQTRE